MLRLSGRVRDVEADKTVRGAFGDEPALGVYVERNAKDKYCDYVRIPDTPENRKVVVAGYGFDAPVTASAVSFNGKTFVSLVADFRA